MHMSIPHLGDRGAVEGLLAVDPSVGTCRLLSPVPPQSSVRGEAGGLGEAEVQAECAGERGLVPGRADGALPAAVGRRGPGEDARQHVEGQEDLG